MPKSAKKRKNAKPTQPPATSPQKLSTKYIAAAASFVVIALAVYFLFIFQKGPSDIKVDEEEGEIKDFSEVQLKDRPYVTLTPTVDGAEIIVSIENMGYFDAIEYELTYLADDPTRSGEKIQRGSTGGDINTKDQKYKTSILLGTASRGVRSPDRGVTDGKLSLHLRKDGSEYLSESEWNLFEIGGTKTTIATREEMVKLEIPPTLGKTYWVILSDTVGIPPTFDKEPQTVVTPTFGTFSIAPKFTKPGSLTIEPQNDLTNAQIHLYTQDGKWETKELQAKGRTFSTIVNNFATFVLTSSQ